MYPIIFLKCPNCHREFWAENTKECQDKINIHISIGYCDKEQKDLEYTRKILEKHDRDYKI